MNHHSVLRNFGALAMLALLYLPAGCSWSTHSASVDVRFPIQPAFTVGSDRASVRAYTAEQERLRGVSRDSYQPVVQIVSDWAAESGFCPVPLDRPHRLTAFTSSDSGPVPAQSVAYFEEHRPPDPGWPIEILVRHIEDLGIIEVIIVEGYGRRPSEKLLAIQREIETRLRREFEEVHASAP